MSAPPPGYPVGPPPAYGPQSQYGTQYRAHFPGRYGVYYGPPPTYPPPGYPPAPAFGPPPGYGVLKPGIIPLRPLTLGDIFNGAVGYIRANPKATLGLTAIVVIAMQIITKAAVLGPLAAYGRFTGDRSDELTAGVLGAWSVSVGAGVLVGWLGGMLLSGMLTVIVGRAVFGSSITIGET